MQRSIVLSTDCAVPGQALSPLELAVRFTMGNVGDLNHYESYQTKFAVRPQSDLSDFDNAKRLVDLIQRDAEQSIQEDNLKSSQKTNDEPVKSEDDKKPE